MRIPVSKFLPRSSVQGGLGVVDDGCEDGHCFTYIPTAEELEEEEDLDRLNWVDSMFTYVDLAKCCILIFQHAYMVARKGEFTGPDVWFLFNKSLQAIAFSSKMTH